MNELTKPKLKLIKIIHDCAIDIDKNTFIAVELEESNFYKYLNCVKQFNITKSDIQVLDEIYSKETWDDKRRTHVTQLRRKFLKYLKDTKLEYKKLDEYVEFVMLGDSRLE